MSVASVTNMRYALALDIYVRVALSRFEQSCVKSESHLYILCNYLPFSKAAKGAQGGPQQHETPNKNTHPLTFPRGSGHHKITWIAFI